MVKFGFVGTYLSEPLVRAYTTAAAGHAVVAQLKYIFGVSPTRFSGPLSLVFVSTASIAVQILPSIVFVFIEQHLDLNLNFSHLSSLILQTLKDVCYLLPRTHLPTLAVSAVSMVFLIAAKELNTFLRPKLPVIIPVELITVS